MEVFIPSEIQDLFSLREKGFQDNVEIHILIVDEYRAENQKFCEEYKTIEDAIQHGYLMADLEGLIAKGNIRLISKPKSKGEEKWQKLSV